MKRNISKFVITAVEFGGSIIILTALFVVMMVTGTVVAEYQAIVIAAYAAAMAIKAALFTWKTITFFKSHGEKYPDMLQAYVGLFIAAGATIALYLSYKFAFLVGLMIVLAFFIFEIIVTMIAYNQRKAEFVETGSIYTGK